MRLWLVFGVIGHVLRPFCLAFLAPAALALSDGQTASALQFSISALATFLLAWFLSRRVVHHASFVRAEAVAVVALTWLSVAALGAVPYVFYGLSFVDAFFESMSGFTTTGATVLRDFGRYDRAFFLWRAMTQWFGGLGVIALFVVVLPRLGIAGRQLFFAEASGAPSEALSPQVRKSAERLWVTYIGLTLTLWALLGAVAGFDWYQGLTHALTTMSAGGFSPNPESIAGYHNPAAEWVLSPFMLLAGASFSLQYRAFSGAPRVLLLDGEFLLYVLVTAAISGGLLLVIPDQSLLDGLRTSLFQVASLISSTGFASTDYNLWSDAARVLLVLAMLVGGCAGSAAGGPKVIRLLLLLKHFGRELKRTLHPRAVLVVRHKGRVVDDDIMRSVFTLVGLYMMGHLVLGAALVLTGSDFVLGFSAALACLGNVGPGFGPAGPMGNFADFSAEAKCVLAAAMWVGRLEMVTVLALLHRDVWRGLRWT